MKKKNQYDTEVHIPPRNWKKNWAAYIGHIVSLALCGVGMASGVPEYMVVGAAYATMYCVYQCIEFARRKDTPARDLADGMWGLTLGALGYISIVEGFIPYFF